MRRLVTNDRAQKNADYLRRYLWVLEHVLK